MTLRTPLVMALVGAIGCGEPRSSPPPTAATSIPIATATATATATAISIAPAPSVAPTNGAMDDFIGRATASTEDASTPHPVMTDDERAKVLDRYASQLARFLVPRMHIPTSISLAEARKLCVTFQTNVSRDLVIWHVRSQPMKASGNALFDDAARAMLEKLVQDRTKLPEPPPEIADTFRARTLVLLLTADPRGDTSSCK